MKAILLISSLLTLLLISAHSNAQQVKAFADRHVEFNCEVDPDQCEMMEFVAWKDTNVFTDLQMIWCDKTEGVICNKSLSPGVYGIHSSSGIIPLDSCRYEMVNNYYGWCDSCPHIFLEEIYDSNYHYIGLLYGSYDYPQGYNPRMNYIVYVIDFEVPDPYKEDYKADELTYESEFQKVTGSYLYRIIEKRSNRLVGIRYYSESNNILTERFIKRKAGD